MLGKVVLRCLEGMDEPLINSIQAILRATMGGMSVALAEGIATLQSLCQEVGCPYHDELCSTTCCVALVVRQSDENGCLAVLHNRNKMVATFGNSEWVTQSEGAVQA